MPGIRSFAALAAFAVLSSIVDALPQSFRHRLPSWQSSQTASAYSTPADASPLTEAPTGFPFLSVEPQHSSLSSTAPHGFTASVFGAAPTGVRSSESSYPTASGAASPSGYPSSPYPVNGIKSRTAEDRNYPDKFRGVNLGSWLLLEQWMVPDVFEGTDAVDQWTFDSTPGAEAKLQQHWSTYITESDFENMSSWGINSVRIPIGYWAYNNYGTPYIQGADAYLEQALGWARTYGMWVMIDCHGSPGSQNGEEHSGHEGAILWQTGDNLQLSTEVLEQIAEKYGTMEYADVVMGIELVNEPKIGQGANSLNTTQWWVQTAYNAVKAKVENPDLYILTHDGFTGPETWLGVGAALNGNASLAEATFAIDVHLYQNQDPTDEALTVPEHVSKACGYTTSALLPSNSMLPLFVAEFSVQMDICYSNDVSVPCTSSCSTTNQDCLKVSDIGWSDTRTIEGTRQYFEAQMDAYEQGSLGWFMWSLKQGSDNNGWSMESIMQNVYGSDKITDRKYQGICSSG